MGPLVPSPRDQDRIRSPGQSPALWGAQPVVISSTTAPSSGSPGVGDPVMRRGERSRSRAKICRLLVAVIFVLQPPFDCIKPEPEISGLSVEGLPQLLASFEQQPQAAVDLGQQR